MMLLLIHQNVRMLCCCNLIWLNHFVPIPKQRYLLLSILNIILETILLVYGFPLCPFNPAPFHPNIGLENCHEIERKITEFNNDSDLHSADMKTFKEAFEKKYWYGYYTELRKSIFAKPADLATDALGLVTVIEPNQLPGLTAVLNYDLEKKKTAAALEEKRLVTNADTAALKIEAKKEVRLRTVEAKQQTDLATIAAPMPTMVAGAPAAASPAMMLPSASRLDHVSPSNQHSSASNSNVPTVLVSSDGESTNNLLEDGEVIDDGGGSKKRARELENSSFVELSDKDTDDSDPTSIKSPKKKMPKTHHGQPSPINTSKDTMKAKTLNQQQQQRIVKLEHLLDTRSGQIESLTSLRRDDLSRFNDHESALRAILRDCSKRGENLPRGWALEWSGPQRSNYFICEESNISIWY